MWIFSKKDKQPKPEASAPAPAAQGSDKSADIRAQALANARAARERLGEDTIQKIAEQLQKHEGKLVEQAKRQIKALDETRVADHLKTLLNEKDKK